MHVFVGEYMKNSFSVGSVVLLGMVGALFANAQEASAAPQMQPIEISVGYSRLRISLPVFVAQERGIFKKHGLKVALQMYDTAQPLMQALVSGRIDVAGYTALPITYNGMLRSGKQLYFLSTMVEDEQHRISYLLRAKANKDIRTVANLKGKVIGILPTIAYKSWLGAILKKNGLNPDKDVTVLQVASMQQLQSLRSGGVDALFTNDPVATSALQLGVAELVSDVVECPKYIQNPFPFGSFNVSKEWADKNPVPFERLGNALDEAVAFVNKHPAQAKEAMKPYLPEAFRPHIAFYPDAKYLESKLSTERLFQNVANMYLGIGIIKKPLSLSGLVVSGNTRAEKH